VDEIQQEVGLPPVTAAPRAFSPSCLSLRVMCQSRTPTDGPGAASSRPSQQSPGSGSGIKDHGLRSGYACQEAARTPGTGSPPAGFCSRGWPGAGIFGLVRELAPLHPRNNTFPGEVFLGLGAGALAGVRPAGPIRWLWKGCGSGSFPGVRSVAARGTSSSLLSWPQRALRGGARPDLLDVVAWWQADDFWRYALFAAVAYIRAAADRAGVPARRVCRELAQRDGPLST
jgi:hypothetical protein